MKLTKTRIHSSKQGWHVDIVEGGMGQTFTYRNHSTAWVEALKMIAVKGGDIEAIYGQDRYGRLDTEQGQQWDGRLPTSQRKLG